MSAETPEQLTPGRVIVVTSGKGGVGKTTTTANIGMALAWMGKRVALVDADIGLRNLDLVLGLENRIVYNSVDVVEGRAKLKQALIKDKRTPNLAFLPAAQTRDKSAITPDQMREMIDEMKLEYDFVLIDCPAGIEQGFKNAIAGADEAIIVTNPEVSSVRDADRVIGFLETAAIANNRLIVNRVRPAMVKSKEMMSVDDVLDILGSSVKLLGVVPDDESIITSTNRGEPAVLSKNGSRAGQAYLNVSRRLLGEDVPFMNLDAGNGFIDKLKSLFK
ncbi:MAG: septum site-determining protein MinD [Candidatus Sericytochromatia bacterium]|nr:septum site-determining protein MinD [Candidatus Sericytochromatia bacterium]